MNLLQDYHKEKGVTLLCSTGDADVLMCREAAECCYSGNVSLLGEDTDLLIILLHMTKHHAFENKLYLTTKSYVYDVEKIITFRSNECRRKPDVAHFRDERDVIGQC